MDTEVEIDTFSHTVASLFDQLQDSEDTIERRVRVLENALQFTRSEETRLRTELQKSHRTEAHLQGTVDNLTKRVELLEARLSHQVESRLSQQVDELATPSPTWSTKAIEEAKRAAYLRATAQIVPSFFGDDFASDEEAPAPSPVPSVAEDDHLPPQGDSGDEVRPSDEFRPNDAERPVGAEKRSGAERQSGAERRSGAERQSAAERRSAAERPGGAERRSGAERQSASERQSTADRQSAAERPSVAEPHSGMERRGGTERRSVSIAGVAPPPASGPGGADPGASESHAPPQPPPLARRQSSYHANEARKLDANWVAATNDRMMELERKVMRVGRMAEGGMVDAMKKYAIETMSHLMESYLQEPIEAASQAVLAHAKTEIEELTEKVKLEARRLTRVSAVPSSTGEIDHISTRLTMLRDDLASVQGRKADQAWVKEELFSLKASFAEAVKSSSDTLSASLLSRIDTAVQHLGLEVTEKLTKQLIHQHDSLSKEISSKASLQHLSDLRRGVSSVLSKSHSSGSRTDEQLITIRDTMREIQEAVLSQTMRAPTPVHDAKQREGSPLPWSSQSQSGSWSHPVGLRTAPLHERLLVAHTDVGQISTATNETRYVAAPGIASESAAACYARPSSASMNSFGLRNASASSLQSRPFSATAQRLLPTQQAAGNGFTVLSQVPTARSVDNAEDDSEPIRRKMHRSSASNLKNRVPGR